MKQKKIATVETEPIELYLFGPKGAEQDEVVEFIGACRIDNDGTGPAQGDPYHQDQTSLKNNGKYLNAQTECFVAVPPQICEKTNGKVLGSLCVVENQNGVKCVCVVGDIGPRKKLGEVSSLAAKVLGVNPDPVKGGDDSHDFAYTIYVNVAAYANGIRTSCKPMANPQIVFNLEQLDDPVLADGVPEFSGGQFSNWRANLLKENQSKLLYNCDVDKLGRIRTRRGMVQIGNALPSGTLVQGLTAYQTKDYNYIVAASGGKIYQWTGSAWVQIATGGTVDNEDILIARIGAVNNPGTPGGYEIGDTVLTVDGITGVVGVGEKLYFRNNLRNDPWEYTIAAQNGVVGGASTTQITLEEPGLVFPVKDNWTIIVSRPAKVNGTHAAGVKTLNIKSYGSAIGGEVNNGEILVIKSENVNHPITSHVGTNPTTQVTWTANPGLIADYASANTTDPIVFAQGNDALYFSDGLIDIYSWNGKVLGRLDSVNTSFLDFVDGTAFHRSRTAPPTACKILVWFQNRLIASGITSEPDAIYFSDYLDPTSWDRDYQRTRIGGGDSDPITNLVPWADYNIICFKKNSILVINTDPNQNPDPTDPTLLVSSFGVKRIHRHLGCPAPFTAVQIGGGSSGPGSDVFFLDFDKKVRSIRRVLAAETQQELGDAVSLPVQDILDQINIQYIGRCVATYHNDHYIIAPPLGASPRPNGVLAYNMLTQSWCGQWLGWFPTCFSLRQDLGDYSRMIFGDWANGAAHVNQWFDDTALQEEAEETYQDNGADIATKILTRAITFGDPFANKTGLYAEFEFDESVADNVKIKVVLDGVDTEGYLATPFDTLSEPRLFLPVTLPFILPSGPKLVRKSFGLQRYGTWRELQFQIDSAADKLSLRSIRVAGFMDTTTIQSLPEEVPPAS